jgi:hypothetical protein
VGRGRHAAGVGDRAGVVHPRLGGWRRHR